MVRMTTLPAAPARRVQTNGPVAAIPAVAPANQARRVIGGALAGSPRPPRDVGSVIVSSLRVLGLRPASGREGVGGPSATGSSGVVVDSQAASPARRTASRTLHRLAEWSGGSTPLRPVSSARWAKLLRPRLV